MSALAPLLDSPFVWFLIILAAGAITVAFSDGGPR